MKDKNFLQIGQKLIIVRTKFSGEKIEYVSQLMDIDENENLVIAVPIKNAQLVTLLNGTQVSILYNNSETGMLEFEAEVLRKVKGRVPMMYIKMIGKITKSQRRNYFRLDFMTPINFIKIKDQSLHSGITKDISGGGLKMIIDSDVEEGDILQLNYVLDNRQYNLKGVVKAKISSIENKIEVGIEFLDIIEIDRNDLTKYLFLQQRMLIKRGM